MRTLAILSVVAVALARSPAEVDTDMNQQPDIIREPRIQQQAGCLVSSAETVSDLIDSSMFIWASVARCGKGGQEVNCEIDIASAVKSVNSMINVILEALAKCGDIKTANYECGLAAGQFTEHTAGIAAAAGGILQKCVSHASLGAWDHKQPAMCVVNVKNTAKALFQTIRAFLTVDDSCNDVSVHNDPRVCASNALRIVSGFAGIGQYLAGTIGQCVAGSNMKGARCAQEATQIVQMLGRVAQSSMDMSKQCGPKPPAPALAPVSYVEPTGHEMLDDGHAEFMGDGRLYSAESKGETTMAPSFNLVLAAFLPVTAFVGFVGGRFYANRHASAVEAREFFSDNE